MYKIDSIPVKTYYVENRDTGKYYDFFNFESASAFFDNYKEAHPTSVIIFGAIIEEQ